MQGPTDLTLRLAAERGDESRADDDVESRSIIFLVLMCLRVQGEMYMGRENIEMYVQGMHLRARGAAGCKFGVSRLGQNAQVANFFSSKGFV